jgi:kynurenine formamidase
MTMTNAVNATVDALLGALRRTTTIDLEQPRYAGAPTFAAHQPGFVYSLHRRHEPGLGGGRTSASGIIVTAEHSGTHIDALCHQAYEQEMFGGVKVTAQVQTSTGFTELGAETIAPMVTRGVLIDVAGFRGADRIPSGDLISGQELQDAAAAQAVSVDPGDVVLVRTGNGALWNDPEEYLKGAGMAPSASDWLAERRVLAVGADNVAWDGIVTIDPDHGTLPGHTILLVRHGIFILENLLLEELAAKSQHEFVFVCCPLKMVGVTGSPVRPLAIVSS